MLFGWIDLLTSGSSEKFVFGKRFGLVFEGFSRRMFSIQDSANKTASPDFAGEPRVTDPPGGWMASSFV